MALSPTSSSDNPTGLTNLAQLIGALAPIFLGSGEQKSTTSGGTSTTAGGTATTGKTTTGNTPDILAALLSSITTANANAVDTSKTDAIVANIMKESAIAFAPTIAQSNAAGLYNSSTLSLLSTEAKARAGQTSAKAVLDYQTGQQQIAQQGLSTLASNNKTADTAQQSTTQQSTTTPSSTTVKVGSPALDPMSSLMTLGGGVAANYLLKALTSGDGGGSSLVSKLSDFLGLSGAGDAAGGVGFTGGAGATAGLTLGGNELIAADPLSALGGGSTTSDSAIRLLLGGGEGANFTDAAGAFSGAPSSVSAIPGSEGGVFSGFLDSYLAPGGALSGSANTLTGFGGSLGSTALDALPILGSIFNAVSSIQTDPGGKGGNSAFGGIAGVGLGTVLGGPIGGALGGALGALGGKMLGPAPPSDYSYTKFATTPEGALSVFDKDFQGKNISREQETAMSQQAAALNRLLSSYGARIEGDYSKGLPFEIGANTPGKGEDPNKFYDFNTPNTSGATALSKLSFSAADNPELDAAVRGKSFSSINDLYGALQGSGVSPSSPLSFEGLDEDAAKLLTHPFGIEIASLLGASSISSGDEAAKALALSNTNSSGSGG